MKRSVLFASIALLLISIYSCSNFYDSKLYGFYRNEYDAHYYGRDMEGYCIGKYANYKKFRDTVSELLNQKCDTNYCLVFSAVNDSMWFVKYLKEEDRYDQFSIFEGATITISSDSSIIINIGSVIIEDEYSIRFFTLENGIVNDKGSIRIEVTEDGIPRGWGQIDIDSQEYSVQTGKL
ncbi:MAG: hypothetical protein MJY66_08825 [Bacteroidaceae bacterium]|nr:hypothetical protein [Bacteroidaceae bacterium]